MKTSSTYKGNVCIPKNFLFGGKATLTTAQLMI